jgi:hypothetical protein
MNSVPWIDSKYISIVGIYLENFKQKSDNRYNCRCPVCGDSLTDKNKSRGWFIKRDTDWLYHCFNCEVSMSVSRFIKTQFPEIYKDYSKEYAKEIYGNKRAVIGKKSTSDVEIKHIPPSDKLRLLVESDDVETPISRKNKVLSEFPTLRELPRDHPARIWFWKRKLSQFLLDETYYVTETKTISEAFGVDSEGVSSCSRVLFPIWDITKSKLLSVTMRDITGKEKNKYLTLRNNRYDTPLLFGIERLNLSTTILVFEGPIDSTFIPNGCAVGNGGVGSAISHPDLVGCDMIFVFDNQPRHKQVVSSMSKAIDQGLRVAFWDEDIHEKDVNDCIMNGIAVSKLLDMFLSSPNTLLKRKLQFSKWRKI